MGGATPPTSIRCSSRSRTTLRRIRSQMFGQYQLKKHTRMTRMKVMNVHVQHLPDSHLLPSSSPPLPLLPLSSPLIPSPLLSTYPSPTLLPSPSPPLSSPLPSFSSPYSSYLELLVFQSWLCHERPSVSWGEVDHPHLWYTLTTQLFLFRAKDVNESCTVYTSACELVG